MAPHLLQHRPEAPAGYNHEDIIRLLESCAEIGFGCDQIRQFYARQVALVAPVLLESCNVICIAIPEPDGNTISRQQHGQRRAPRASPENCYGGLGLLLHFNLAELLCALIRRRDLGVYLAQILRIQGVEIDRRQQQLREAAFYHQI